MGRTGTGQGLPAALAGGALPGACAIDGPAGDMAVSDPVPTCPVAVCSRPDVPAGTTAEDRRAAEITASIDAMAPAARAEVVLGADEAAGCPPDGPTGGAACSHDHDRVLRRLGAGLGMGGDAWRVFRDGFGARAMGEAAALAAAGRPRAFDAHPCAPRAFAGDSARGMRA
jgi:hypothetical protein